MTVLTASGKGTQQPEVLTLAEAAEFLRVSDEVVATLAAEGALPAQLVGSEWRFLKRALADWLRYGPEFYREIKKHPHSWLLGDSLLEGLAAELEKRLLGRLAASEEKRDKPGSKQAVLKHFGVFQEDDDLEARLADARAQREAGG
jgi:excisionase family DNA binding protein